MLDFMVRGNMTEEEDKKILSDKELQSNVSIFFVAGHETTSTALSFGISLLAKHQDIQEKMRKEIIEILGNEKPNFENIKKVNYVTYFIKETMRHFPPVEFIPPKLTTKDVELEGYHIPKDTLVGGSVFAVHFSKEIYGDPENFRPERWSPEEQLKKKIPSNAWIPFSNGPRICVGNNFSLLEQKIFYVELLSRFKISLVDENVKIRKEPIATFVISHPEKVKIKFSPLK